MLILSALNVLYAQVGTNNLLYQPLTQEQLESPLLNKRVKAAFADINKIVHLNPYFAYEQMLKGFEYAKALESGNLETIPTKSQEEYLNSIIALMWYLYNRALEKNQPFTEGTFVIQDKDFILYNFLLAYVIRFNPDLTGTVADKPQLASFNPFAYARGSTHFKAEQYNEKTGKGFIQYGIDVRFGQLGASLPLLPVLKKAYVFWKDF